MVHQCHNVPFHATKLSQHAVYVNIYAAICRGFLDCFGKFVSIKTLSQCYPNDCKTVYPGSIPGVASNT